MARVCEKIETFETIEDKLDNQERAKRRDRSKKRSRLPREPVPSARTNLQPTRIDADHPSCLVPRVPPFGERLLNRRSEPDFRCASSGVLRPNVFLLAYQDVRFR